MYQRGIGENHENIVGAARDRGLRREHRMRRSTPFGLHDDFRAGREALRLGGDDVVIRSDHDGGRRSAGRAHSAEHMRQ